ncbi:WD-40 repeat protein [Reticulomyxa filosa]|uniref:WD-40 repeat protein n=1 Tax=Reticulomyxa filosa TaxID=46433 RepID=X6PFA7_RETFI|nr:WD-40 repeat protein [Reticulomyxa filosa]|eukprot:ETO36861.1 WD-40 repeat protein [Reticulomyxa filosa]
MFNYETNVFNNGLILKEVSTLNNKFKEELLFYLFKKKFKYFHLNHLKRSQLKTKDSEEKIQMVIQHWIQISGIKLGWTYDLGKIIFNYVRFFYFVFIQLKFKYIRYLLFDIDNCCFHARNIFIDYLTFSDDQLICSGSSDNTIRVWDIKTKRQTQLFNGHLGSVICVKFSPYHYRNNSCHVICSSSLDNTIRFWDFKHKQQLQIFNEYTGWVGGMEFSPFNNGRYLCSGAFDNAIRLWDIETYKLLHVFNGHTNGVWCVDFSPLQSNNYNDNDNKRNSIGMIGGNGYTVCSGSLDSNIRIWDIETTKQISIFKGHTDWIRSVKYGSNELGNIGGSNTILSGSDDCSIRLWDIRSAKQIQLFNGHTNFVSAVEYSPFVVNNVEIGGSSNVICSGSKDSKILFWDIRSNKKLYMIKGDEGYDGIMCLKFLKLKKKEKKGKSHDDRDCSINICYGSCNGHICIWG